MLFHFFYVLHFIFFFHMIYFQPAVSRHSFLVSVSLCPFVRVSVSFPLAFSFSPYVYLFVCIISSVYLSSVIYLSGLFFPYVVTTSEVVAAVSCFFLLLMLPLLSLESVSFKIYFDIIQLYLIYFICCLHELLFLDLVRLTYLCFSFSISLFFL